MRSTTPGHPIVHPDALEEVDYEVELGAVIGRTEKDVATEDARDYIAGYTESFLHVTPFRGECLSTSAVTLPENC